MPEGQTRTELLEAMAEMPVIDAHEHLPPERQRTDAKVDFATLFSHYTQADLKSSGMTEAQYQTLQSEETDLDEKWRLFEPFWERIRFTGYARPALIAAREFYGCEDISEKTYRQLSERMQAANTPGIYERLLRKKCKIKVCLTQIGQVPDANQDLLCPLLPMAHWTTAANREQLSGRAAAFGVELKNLEDYMVVMRAGLEDWKAQGVVGMKTVATHLGDPTRDDAEMQFRSLMAGKDQEFFLLRWYLHQQMLAMAGELDLVVAVHCGIIWDNWNNFYANHPRNLIPILLKHRQTRFDLYHAAIPWPRDLAVMGKDFPNVHLNLCWCHIISPRMTRSFLDEWIDMVPINKISGFGGDYSRPVEKVYGHLLMAKENIASVLGNRVDEGLMSWQQALAVSRRMLHDNPKELYGLDV